MSNKKKSSYIPIYFIAFILTFVAIDAIYICVAKNTYSGVYTDDHYQKGIDYSKANSKGIGVIGDEDMDFEKRVEGSKVIFQLQDKNGSAVKFNDLKVKAIRPTSKKYDTIIRPTKNSGSRFELDFSDFLNGQWEVRIKFKMDEGEFYRKYRIEKNKEKIRLRK